MSFSEKVSPEGMRIGYLYDNAHKDDKKVIDAILLKYSELFPLIYTGLEWNMVTDIEKARYYHTIMDTDADSESKKKLS